MGGRGKSESVNDPLFLPEPIKLSLIRGDHFTVLIRQKMASVSPNAGKAWRIRNDRKIRNGKECAWDETLKQKSKRLGFSVSNWKNKVNPSDIRPQRRAWRRRMGQVLRSGSWAQPQG